MSANNATRKRSHSDCVGYSDQSSYTPLKKGKTGVCEPAQPSTFSDLVVGAISFVKSFFIKAPAIKECTCARSDMCAMCIQKNDEKIEAERIIANNYAMLEARKAQDKAEEERLQAEAKAEEERLLKEREGFSILWRLSSMKYTTERGGIGYQSDDGSNDCFAIKSENKIHFFILDGQTSTIKVLDYGTEIIIHRFPLNPDRCFKISNERKQELYFECVPVGNIQIDNNLGYQIVQQSSLFDPTHGVRLKETDTVSNYTGASFTFSNNCKCNHCDFGISSWYPATNEEISSYCRSYHNPYLC